MPEAEQQLERLIRRIGELPHRVVVREVHDFFRMLPPESAQALAENRPDLVAPLEGAPPQLRYRASLLILDQGRQQLQALVESKQATTAQKRRLETLDEMLQPVSQGLVATPDGQRVHVFGPRQFLYAEVEGQGRMIEVLGDLEKARNVVVLIPGMNNDLDRVRSQLDRAQEIKNEVGPNTAVVVWQGYYAPIGLEEGISTDSSVAAQPLLSRFEAGLDVVRAPDSATTFIGNSYGAQVLGRALKEAVDRESPDGVNPDRAVLVGSPGVDESVTSAAQITPSGTQLYVARSKGDYVSYAEHHGPDPAGFPDVFRFETDGDVSIRGHMSYFELNSESMRNVGRIGRGDLDLVTRATATSPEQESRLLPGLSWSEPLRKVADSRAAVPLAKVFDGVQALQAISSPAKKNNPLAGRQERHERRRLGTTTPRRPEGPAR